jgi:hypothetical protein
MKLEEIISSHVILAKDGSYIIALNQVPSKSSTFTLFIEVYKDDWRQVDGAEGTTGSPIYGRFVTDIWQLKMRAEALLKLHTN